MTTTDWDPLRTSLDPPLIVAHVAIYIMPHTVNDNSQHAFQCGAPLKGTDEKGTTHNGTCDKGTCKNGTTEIRIKIAHLNISGYIYVVSTKLFNLVIKIIGRTDLFFLWCFWLIGQTDWLFYSLIYIIPPWIVVTSKIVFRFQWMWKKGFSGLELIPMSKFQLIMLNIS